VRGGWVCIHGCKREGLGGSGTRSPAHVASDCVVVQFPAHHGKRGHSSAKAGKAGEPG
jgi:hypothetical protein